MFSDQKERQINLAFWYLFFVFLLSVAEVHSIGRQWGIVSIGVVPRGMGWNSLEIPYSVSPPGAGSLFISNTLEEAGGLIRDRRLI